VAGSKSFQCGVSDLDAGWSDIVFRSAVAGQIGSETR
jgi:hypothetical protein